MNHLQNISCPFCREDVQAGHFAASDNFLAIYNLAPILQGHSLVIPRRHIISLLEPLVERVVVANPIKVEQIAQARVKTDIRDTLTA